MPAFTPSQAATAVETCLELECPLWVPSGPGITVNRPPAAAARHGTKTEGTYLKIAAKIKTESRKLATTMTAETMPSGSPSAAVRPPARTVMIVDRTNDTRSKKAAASTRLKESSLPLMNDHTPPGRGGASHILSSASCSEPTKPAAANNRTPRATSPDQPLAGRSQPRQAFV